MCSFPNLLYWVLNSLNFSVCLQSMKIYKTFHQRLIWVNPKKTVKMYFRNSRSSSIKCSNTENLHVRDQKPMHWRHVFGVFRDFTEGFNHCRPFSLVSVAAWEAPQGCCVGWRRKGTGSRCQESSSNTLLTMGWRASSGIFIRQCWFSFWHTLFAPCLVQITLGTTANTCTNLKAVSQPCSCKD